MKFKIRESKAEDMDSVLNLIHALAVFEKEPDAVELSVDDLVRDGFGVDKRFHCFVADVQNAVVGMALVYPRYSTWKGPIIHLEDLIVSETMRGKGIGDALLGEVVKYGESVGAKRISWEVLDWNQPAIDFYEKKGAHVMRDWNVVQLNQEGIKHFFDV